MHKTSLQTLNIQSNTFSNSRVNNSPAIDIIDQHKQKRIDTCICGRVQKSKQFLQLKWFINSDFKIERNLHNTHLLDIQNNTFSSSRTNNFIAINSTIVTSQPCSSIQVRVTNRLKTSPTIPKRRNPNNLITIKPAQSPLKATGCVCFALWNAQSINKKAASICELVISKRLDLLAFTETWLSSSQGENSTIAEITNTLLDYDFIHTPRLNKTGGGVGILLRKGFSVSQNDVQFYKSMEYLDLHICSNRTNLRLVIIYRICPSKKNKLTAAMFFVEFSALLETLMLTPGYLLLAGDFNFHIDVPRNPDTIKFNDLLESAGLQQWVTGPTHRCGHTLDLLIDRQGDSLISSCSIDTISTLPSDHFAVLGSLDIPKPQSSKKSFTFRDFKRIDQAKLRIDLGVTFNTIQECQLNERTENFISALRGLLDHHAPEKTCLVTLRPKCAVV